MDYPRRCGNPASDVILLDLQLPVGPVHDCLAAVLDAGIDLCAAAAGCDGDLVARVDAADTAYWCSSTAGLTGEHSPAVLGFARPRYAN